MVISGSSTIIINSAKPGSYLLQLFAKRAANAWISLMSHPTTLQAGNGHFREQYHHHQQRKTRFIFATTFCEESGKCLDFFDVSSNNPTSWQWSFPGAVPSSSTAQNPVHICYNFLRRERQMPGFL